MRDKAHSILSFLPALGSFFFLAWGLKVGGSLLAGASTGWIIAAIALLPFTAVLGPFYAAFGLGDYRLLGIGALWLIWVATTSYVAMMVAPADENKSQTDA